MLSPIFTWSMFHKALPHTPAQILNHSTCPSISKLTDNADHWGFLGSPNPSKKTRHNHKNEEVPTAVIYKAYKRMKSQDCQTSTWVNYYVANMQNSRWVAAMYLMFKGTLFPEATGLSHWQQCHNKQTTAIHHQFMTEARLAGLSI